MGETAQGILEESLSHAVDLAGWENASLRRAMALLDSVDADLEREIALAIARNPGSDRVRRLSAIRRELASVNAEAYRRVLRGHEGLGDGLAADLLAGASAEADWAGELLGTHLPFAWSESRPDPALLKALVERHPFQGGLLKDHVAKLEADRLAAITREVDHGLLEGETTDAILRRIRGLESNRFADGVLERVGRRNLDTIARTAIQSTHARARELTYEANEDIISGLLWVSTLDDRTCPICQGRDGLAWTLGDHEPMGHGQAWDGGPGEIHMKCRCSSSAILKDVGGLSEVVDLEALSRGERAALDGPVPVTTDYAEWIRGAPADVQDRALGVRRARALREGTLSLGHLWGLDFRQVPPEPVGTVSRTRIGRLARAAVVGLAVPGPTEALIVRRVVRAVRARGLRVPPEAPSRLGTITDELLEAIDSLTAQAAREVAEAGLEAVAGQVGVKLTADELLDRWTSAVKTTTPAGREVGVFAADDGAVLAMQRAGVDPEDFVAGMRGGDSRVRELSFSLSDPMDEGIVGFQARFGGFDWQGAFGGTFEFSNASATIDLLTVSPVGKGGTGVMRRLLRGQVELAERAGIKTVEITAGSTHGGYAWAKYGFVPDRDQWQQFRETLPGLITKRAWPGLPDDVRSAATRILSSDDPRSIWALADLRTLVEHPVTGRREQFARIMLMNKRWDGRLDLTDPAAMARFDRMTGRAREARVPAPPPPTVRAMTLDDVVELMRGSNYGVPVGGDGRTDAALEAILARQGFDRLPQVISQAEFERFRDAGSQVLYRGISGALAPEGAATKWAEEFRSGPYFAGRGVHGSGIYATKSREVAEFYSTGGVMLRMVLAPDARVITLQEARGLIPRAMQMLDGFKAEARELHRQAALAASSPLASGARAAELADKAEKLERWIFERESEIMRLFGDEGRAAAFFGYDAINIGYGSDETMVILNRAKVLVVRE